jgi:hypothetical protein
VFIWHALGVFSPTLQRGVWGLLEAKYLFLICVPMDLCAFFILYRGMARFNTWKVFVWTFEDFKE